MKISAAEIHNAGPKGILWHQILSLVVDDVKKIQAKPITLADKKKIGRYSQPSHTPREPANNR